MLFMQSATATIFDFALKRLHAHPVTSAPDIYNTSYTNPRTDPMRYLPNILSSYKANREREQDRNG